MELKDVILSTLAEIEEIVVKTPFDEEAVSDDNAPSFASILSTEMPSGGSDEEVRMLEGIRERLLVLFEGFQSPNNVNIEAKVDLTLNFFEYLLATIDNRLDTIR